ncbi:MAG: signal peptidase I [Candidatus Altiarchaeota archaeon]|nr:signal peptidase I [Candidatus Altiarchaeota archaeon]
MKFSKILYDIAWAFTVAMILRIIFGIFLGTSFPFVAVMSSSMSHDVHAVNNYFVWMEQHGFGRNELAEFPLEFGFNKGDALVIGSPSGVEVGDVVVYVNPNLGYAIIHRVINATTEGYVTKGDRNPSPDPWIVKPDWLKGKAVVLVPLLGWIRVFPSDFISFIGSVI